MRLRSEVWVKAFLRRLQGEGVPAVIVRRGNAEAGAIFICINCLDGTARLFGPAPAGLSVSDTERRFTPLLGGSPKPERDVSEYLMRQAEFDSDIWVVEAEDRAGRSFLEDWLARDD
ncbi:DUF1491 family protein [Methyloligella sp. 2.7D]|uniref:DUF1491 family protein n=1 Tax=unclassified Methyloligella TaxID=2625955 RepID=UPI00157C79FE|nr:DUF1491 family protein [Methyloligella sp. GL2]QKP77097.1 DUF1491 family protein [Methyloligella sp. GL2]